MTPDENKRAMERVLEITEEIQVAETDDERARLIEELRQLAMAGLGVKGTA